MASYKTQLSLVIMKAGVDIKFHSDDELNRFIVYGFLVIIDSVTKVVVYCWHTAGFS